MNGKTLKKIARIGLGGILIFAGVSHLTFARKDFQAQVPDWIPLDIDDNFSIPLVSGLALWIAFLIFGA